jgi:hypothetical protein
MVAPGCGKSDANRATICGQVTLDGKPIEQGSISFTPIQGAQGTAVGATIKDGQYRLSAAQGPGIGMNRVEISSIRKTGRKIAKGMGGTGLTMEETAEAVAPRFNSNSNVTLEIKAGDNVGNFEAFSK